MKQKICKTHQWKKFGTEKFSLVLCKVCGAKKEEDNARSEV